MMKVLVALCCFLTMSLHAQANWIPLEPQNIGNKTKENNNQSQSVPVTQLFDKVKIIHQLLDKTGTADETNEDGKKNWFIIENTQK